MHMFNTARIKHELKRLGMIREKIEKVLDAAPEGTIYFRRRGKKQTPLPYRLIFIEKKRKRTRIPDSEEKLIKWLRYKKYAKHIRARVLRNIRILQQSLLYQPLDESFLAFGGELFADCREYFFGKRPGNAAFDALKERQNPFRPEQRRVKTKLGAFRTKGERDIAFILTELGLRFKYEAACMLPGVTRYPDFTVLHPMTGELIYIELCGLMHKAGYREDMAEKLEEYARGGIYLGYNLFIITELPDRDLDMEALTDHIRGIFGL